MKKVYWVSILVCSLVFGFGNSAQAKGVKLKSDNGIKFKAEFHAADNEKSPAVLILPGRSGKKSPYKGISDLLQKAGISVLRIDYNKLSKLSSNTSRKNWKKVFVKRGETDGLVKNEVSASLKYLRSLPKVDAKRIGILGGSMGTWVGFVAMAQDPDIKSLVMLSPICAVSGKSFKTYEGTGKLAEAFGARDLLLIGSEKDRSSEKFPTAVEKAEYLASIMPTANIEKKYYPGKSHSFKMLNDHSELSAIIVDWFKKSLGK